MARETSRRRLLRSAAAAAAATGLAGAAGAAPVGAPDVAGGTPIHDAPYTVQAAQFAWAPEVLVVPTGATVTFQGGRIPHTVTSAATIEDAVNCTHNGESEDTYEGIRSGGEYVVDSADDAYSLFISQGENKQVTYEVPGDFPYYCVPHCDQVMVGTVRVRDL